MTIPAIIKTRKETVLEPQHITVVLEGRELGKMTWKGDRMPHDRTFGMKLISRAQFNTEHSLEVTAIKLTAPNTWRATVQPFTD